MTTTELVPIEAASPPTLYGTADPKTIIDSATAQASALASVVKSRKLYSVIQGRQYVRVEGWTLLGTLLGVFPVLEWTRPLETGWEARVEAKTLDGRVVGAAEAQCTRGENTWAKRDDYALRSMAQTRATAKALRVPLGFVMSLAGYEATPAEEIPDEHVIEGQSRPVPSRAASAPKVSRETQAKVVEAYDLVRNAHPEFTAVVKPEIVQQWPHAFSKPGQLGQLTEEEAYDVLAYLDDQKANVREDPAPQGTLV